MSFCPSRLDRNDAVFDTRRVGLHTVAAIRRPRDSAGFEIHLPGMQRAHDGFARDDAVAERPALMRTLVVDCEEPVAEIENRDLPLANERRASFTRWDAVACGNPNPTHDNTLSIG